MASRPNRPVFNSLHGDPDASVDARNNEPDCTRCGNKRFILQEVWHHGTLVETHQVPCPVCGVAQQWKVDSVKAFSSRSSQSVRQTFFNFKATFSDGEDDILAACLHDAEAFAAHPDERWLVIWGERGSGKSHLCAAVDNELNATGRPSLFITMPDLIASLRQAMDLQSNTEQESYSGRMNAFKNAPVLILDDLGAETGSAWSDGVLFEILDYRYRNRLPTMIASNVNPDHFDPRIASRIQDTSLSTVIENASADYRRRPVAEK